MIAPRWAPEDGLNAQGKVYEEWVIGRGYTKRLMATGGPYDLELRAMPDADLDGTFRAWDCAAEEWLDVNGWLFEMEEL